MPLDMNVVEVPTGSDVNRTDRKIIAHKAAVANVVGASAGASVATVVSGFTELPASYAVVVTPNQDAVAYVTAKSNTGFTVTLNPRLAANTLAAGTFDVVVLA